MKRKKVPYKYIAFIVTHQNTCLKTNVVHHAVFFRRDCIDNGLNLPKRVCTTAASMLYKAKIEAARFRVGRTQTHTQAHPQTIRYARIFTH